jgi:glycosyltransferase involved in cell wall biosynthesis
MKILHIISSGGMYGAEAVILNMSRMMNESHVIGATSNCCALGIFSNSSNPNTQLHTAALAEGIEAHLIPCTGQIDRSVLAKIRELVAQTGVDVVHAHGYKADIYTYFALRKTRTPFVSTCHTWYDNDLMVTLYGVMDRFVLRKFAAVVAVSDEVKQRLLNAGVHENKIYSIRNGIDLRPLTGAAPVLRKEYAGTGVLLVGLVGRLSKEKGVDLFLRAAAVVSNKIPDARFVVAGEGPDREQLELLIDELKLREKATMLGRRDDMPSVYASLDVMVSASRQEGLPMAILEGMASQRPVIAAAVGELPSVIQAGESGVLVPAENVDALAAKMEELLRDSALRKLLGVAARRRVEQEYSAERMTAEYVAVYENVLAEHKQEAIGTAQSGTSGAAK